MSLRWIIAQGFSLHLHNTEGAWPDLRDQPPAFSRTVAMPEILRLPGGTSEGRSVVMLRLDVGDEVIVLETTARALITAALGIRAACEAAGETDLPHG